MDWVLVWAFWQGYQQYLSSHHILSTCHTELGSVELSPVSKKIIKLMVAKGVWGFGNWTQTSFHSNNSLFKVIKTSSKCDRVLHCKITILVIRIVIFSENHYSTND